MSKQGYRFGQPVRTSRESRERRAAVMSMLFLLIFFTVLGIVIYDILHLKSANFKKSSGPNIHQVIAGPETFRSTYFQFSDNIKWKFEPNDSNANRFVWFTYFGGVPVDSLTVYINEEPTQGDLASTNVLPVQIKNQNSFIVGKLSDKCSTVYVPSDLMHIKLKSLDGTNMLCVPDSPQLSIQVGQIGGNYDLVLRRSNGSSAHYIIIYHNLSINPDPTVFERIMGTFQSL